MVSIVLQRVPWIIVKSFVRRSELEKIKAVRKIANASLRDFWVNFYIICTIKAVPQFEFFVEYLLLEVQNKMKSSWWANISFCKITYKFEKEGTKLVMLLWQTQASASIAQSKLEKLVFLRQTFVQYSGVSAFFFSWLFSWWLKSSYTKSAKSNELACKSDFSAACWT